MKDIKLEYQRIREQFECLCEPLKPEDYVVQPIYYASPPKWHLAHTTWFFEEMILKKYLKSYKQFNDEFGFLFNSYYNTVGERTLRAERGNITRPGVDEVMAYRKYVDENMLNLLSESLNNSARNLAILGLNHEQQHQELFLTDLKFILGHNPMFPIYRDDFNLMKHHNTEKGSVAIEEGIYEVGFNGDGFSFDNESKRHKVYILPFEISKTLVTNGEYLEFMKSGGYKEFKHWLDEGWSWLNENNINSPLYWHKIEGEWYYYTLAGLKKVDPDAILAHVSFYEANAFAAWKGSRLPTEFEWEVASEHFDWGERWEWTNSAYLPYPDFDTSEGAVGEYNGKFMVNQMVLRGSSVATPKDHSRRTYRNFFHPHFQWQYSGIRLIV